MSMRLFDEGERRLDKKREKERICEVAALGSAQSRSHVMPHAWQLGEGLKEHSTEMIVTRLGNAES